MDQSQMMNRNYGLWLQPPPPPPPVTGDPTKYQNSERPRWSNWKSKNSEMSGKDPLSIGNIAAGYGPQNIPELQSQNRLKARRFYQKKRFNNRFPPFAPRNTTSFIIRAKKSGGIASLVSPCPVTPATLPTPKFSPSREVLVDMAKEEWGVDGYGSMKGLIRLRSPGHEAEEEEDGGGGSSVEVERRLDHDLSRFEMIYPNGGGDDHSNLLENRVDVNDFHVSQLEEENLTLKERLFLMEGELEDLRRRVQWLETNGGNGGQARNIYEEASENEGGGGGDVSSEKSVGDCDFP